MFQDASGAAGYAYGDSCGQPDRAAERCLVIGCGAVGQRAVGQWYEHGRRPRPGADTGAEGGSGADPLHGVWTLADALKGVPGKGPPVAHIATTKGNLECKLKDDKAPKTVANFIGLATGQRPFRDAKARAWVKRPAYDGTTFHRIIKGFMIQGGDPLGNGSGEPGYVIDDEIWAGAKHDKAGLLCMANRGKNTNGAQFFITDAAAPHLDGSYTIFGECAPESIVHDIASVPVDGEAPRTPITLTSVKITREKAPEKGAEKPK